MALPARVLIANRGEIAVRVAETCRRLGIETVGIGADSDAGALFTRRVDQLVIIGGATAAESYLRGDRIIQAALEAGAEALHPGYGFLSERPEFAEACAGAGIQFIGPPAAAMRLLGDKISALRLAAQCGIPTIQGYRESDQTPERLAREAEGVGYPLLVKAAAGGGGRGMRVIHEPAALMPAVEAARREALAAFGDGTVFLERRLARPRHVEVQLLADGHGNVLVLGDRDCSVQRRHQKVVEEAPAPGLDESRRQAMHAAARRLAEAAAYINAGTVEFLVDDAGFYFLEMNTRLQVEHPVTEQVTGLDIVELQIRAAAGERLAIEQRDIVSRGCAIEARLNAEDPARGFLPSSGVIDRCDLPRLPGVRVDTGVEQGSHINPHFDSLLAKIIAEGPTREIAARRLDAALARTVIGGIATNRDFLRAILGHPAFIAAEHTTDFLAQYEPALLPRPKPPSAAFWLAAALGAAHAEYQAGEGAREGLWSSAFGGWRHGAARRVCNLTCEGENRTVVLLRDPGGTWRQENDEGAVTARVAHDKSLEIVQDGGGGHLRVRRTGLAVSVAGDTEVRQFSVAPPPAMSGPHSPAASGDTGLTAPMPGVVVKHFVEVGTVVSPNQPLLAIEAMKMEHIVIAPYGGTVTQMPIDVGALAAAGAVLAVLEPKEGSRADG